jgi:hypothetical protein
VRVIEEIDAECARQVEVEGWTVEHDDGHRKGELADAAAAYAVGPGRYPFSVGVVEHPAQSPPMFWPWSLRWWKPKTRRRDLVRAAALIVKEIERIDRASGACKTCGSRHPHLHPAVQFEGEVGICVDDFHLRPTPQNLPTYIEAVLAKRAASSTA